MDITYRLQGLAFEWDDQKARVNLDKHGIAFEEAAEVFLDPFSRGGDASVGGEDRSLVIGYSFSHHLLLVVHTERPRGTRIISARAATRAERKLYEGL